MARRVRYSVAASLDGYIAGPGGEADWIVVDPDIDFGEMFSSYDTFLMGRRTYEVTRAMDGGAWFPTRQKVIVFSRTLRQEDHPGLEIVAEGAAERVRELRALSGKDIWLFGGGVLFRGCLEEGLVDEVEVAVIPVLLGEGIPFLAPPARRRALTLIGHRVYPKTGTVMLRYAVENRQTRDRTS